MDFKLLPNGDRAVSVIFPTEISEKVSQNVLAMCAAIDAERLPGIITCIPAYHTLLVEYDERVLTYGQVAMWLRSLSFHTELAGQGRTITLPVCYGGTHGPDLEVVSAYTGLSADEIIDIHTSGVYRVYMLGFRPGFPYLGGMDARLATPRKEFPRTYIERGSVGIAGQQTGVYPEQSPGGWNIIGQTPVDLFNSRTLALLKPGDTLRFTPISGHTYEAIQERGEWPL